MSNIDDEGRFIEDEAFEYAGEAVLRKKGTSARGLMRSWVQLRRENPQARKLVQEIELMQQPSGFQDSIISKWRIEAQASQYVQKLHSRDINASYLSSSARMASFLSHEVNHFLAGKITAVLQLTDTDVAFSLKAAARRSQEQLRRELRQKDIEEDIA